MSGNEVGLNVKGSDETKAKPKDRGEDKDDKEIDEEIVLEEEENKSENKEKEKNKEVDPASFTLLVTIGSLIVGKALLDLGASINLIPLSMLKKIGELEIKPTRVTLQLADRSIKYLHGVVEDVLVKVDKFLFLVDFVIMEMEEDIEVPLVLGRPL
ncbi:uncharacterized protein LOC114163502 [Vigna unguiculata]|uniref:uncharacterized protein LOC114163502 n=1 Tax=Vigna unguiculata TaxID=3917 RepID=UPI001016A186|nr:uncharacterized protein LOC114163502 [Vigna unguiculata]